MPNSTTRSWSMFLPLAAVLLLSLLWSIYWFVASGIAQTRLAEERTRLAAQGLTLTCSQEDWGGYPFHFELTCVSPVLNRENQAEIASSRLLLTALAYAPWQVVALLDGPSTITAAAVPPTTADHQRIIAAITFDKDWKPKLSAEIPTVSVPGHGSADKVMLHTRPSPQGGTDVAISARNVKIERPGKPLIAIGEGEFTGTLSGMTLTVQRVALQQDAVRYWGSGTMELDVQNRPSGKLDTETNDLDGLLALLEPHLQITPENKAGLRAILGLLGNEAKAPLIAKDGVLYLGPFKISEIKPLY
jgi:hypothetical protein